MAGMIACCDAEAYKRNPFPLLVAVLREKAPIHDAVVAEGHPSYKRKPSQFIAVSPCMFDFDQQIFK